MTKERIIITVEDAEPNGVVPFIPRLRRLLKAMLRGYGVRVRDIRPAIDPAPEAAAEKEQSQ